MKNKEYKEWLNLVIDAIDLLIKICDGFDIDDLYSIRINVLQNKLRGLIKKQKTKGVK